MIEIRQTDGQTTYFAIALIAAPRKYSAIQGQGHLTMTLKVNHQFIVMSGKTIFPNHTIQSQMDTFSVVKWVKKRKINFN